MAEFASGDARLAQPSHQPHVRRPAPAQRPHEWESYGPTGVLRLQTQAGNAAVSTVMQRAPAGGADRDAKVEAALSASPPDAGLVKDIGNFEGLPHEKLAKLANILVYHYSLFFGPNDRSTLRAILEAFGPEIGVLAQLKPFLLEKILKEWPELAMTVGPIKVSADSFKTVVGAEAKKNLNDNIAYLESEYKRLWGEQSADPKATLKSSQEQNQRAMAMTKVAGSLLALRRQQKRMLEQVVGFKYNEHNPVAPTSPVTFKPGKAPDATWHTQEGGEKYRELSAQWALSSMLVGENAAQYPWLFGILKDPENAEARLAELATQKDPYQARVQIQQEMTKQLNLAKALERLLRRSLVLRYVLPVDADPVRLIPGAAGMPCGPGSCSIARASSSWTGPVSSGDKLPTATVSPEPWLKDSTGAASNAISSRRQPSLGTPHLLRRCPAETPRGAARSLHRHDS